MPPRDTCAVLGAIAKLREIQRVRAERDAREAGLAARRQEGLVRAAEGRMDAALEGWTAAASGSGFDPAARLRWGAAVGEADGELAEQREGAARAGEHEQQAREIWCVSGIRAEQGAQAYAAASRAAIRRREERIAQEAAILRSRHSEAGRRA